MKKNVLLVVLLFVWTLNTKAQFNESIGTHKVQFGQSVQSIKYDSGYIVAGTDQWDGVTIGRSDASLVRVAPDGSIVWSYLYGHLGNEGFNSVREVSATSGSGLPRGFAALGTTESFSGTPDMYFVRIDQNGAPLFSYVYGRGGKDYGHCLQYIKDYETGKYGYVMVGQSNSYTYYGGTTDILVTKIDEFGTIVRSTVMGGGGEDIGYWIEQTDDGGFILVGSTTSANCPGLPNNKDIIVVRLDAKLRILWNTILGDNALATEDVAYGVVQNPNDKSFTLTGFTKSYNGHEGDAFLINLKPTGGLNWMRTYDTRKEDRGRSIHLAQNICGEVEYVVSGVTLGYSGREDAYVFKTDRLGNQKWTFAYGTPEGIEEAAEITGGDATGYVFTGLAESTVFTNYRDIYLVKMDDYGKSHSCEDVLRQEDKAQFPCEYSSLQQVYVHDMKRVQIAVKNPEYRERKCDLFSSSNLERKSSDPLEEEIVITPNPATHAITVKARTTDIRGAEIQIRNRNGVTIYSSSIASDTTTINITGFANDLYVIEIITPDGQRHNGKFLKE